MTAHLTREELQRWWDLGSPADRDRVVGHLAECDACGTLYGEIMDAQAPPVARAGPVDRSLIDSAYRVYRAPRPQPRFWSWPRTAFAALAALIAAAFAIPALKGPVTRPVDEGGVRGTTLQALTPIGSVTAPVRFQWSSPVRAARYTLEIREGGQRIVLQVSSTSEDLQLDSEAEGRFEVGPTYTWQVIAFDEDGEEMMRAPPRDFSIVRPER